MANKFYNNTSARIVSRVSKNNKLRTETQNRDSGFDMAVTTDKKTRATSLFIDSDGGHFNGGNTLSLDGHQARTLYRLLTKHYAYAGMSFDPIKVTIGS